MTSTDLHTDIRDHVAIVRLTRGKKRNALSDGLILALRDTFQNLPATVRVAVIDGEGEHFCAGLDLSELKERDAGQGVHHSRMWHAALDCIQSGPVPVVAALHGAVVGGGLELASACHIRVADDTAFYALPEGSRGIFVGGGGSVRIPRLIGTARMMDMMLTGRVYNAQDGERLGFAQYLVPAGQSLPAALELARELAAGAQLPLRAIKETALATWGMSEGEAMALRETLASVIAVKQSEDQVEGAAAFAEGREPEWKGR